MVIRYNNILFPTIVVNNWTEIEIIYSEGILMFIRGTLQELKQTK